MWIYDAREIDGEEVGAHGGFADSGAGAAGVSRATKGEGEPATEKKMLDGLVAIVTGAGGPKGLSLGRSYAEGLAQQGAAVVLNDVMSKGGFLLEIEDNIRTKGGRAITVPGDITNPLNVEQIVSTAMSEYGRVDILVNNAGIGRDVKFPEMDRVRHWDPVIAVNLQAWYLLTQRAFAAMQQTSEQKPEPYGRIISIASPTNVIGNYGQVNYGASKGAIMSAALCLAVELMKESYRGKITSNVVIPIANTEMTKGAWQHLGIPAEVAAEQFHPDLVAPMIVALASPQAADRNGRVYVARGNRFQEEVPVLSEGMQFDGTTPVSPQAILTSMDRISYSGPRATMRQFLKVG
ncbi:SDR family NAD(P)-dependent oxidoreductase [Candidatus Woesearchaeota archaeon]|nr:SDR family NAD(P)-dependent oxidoreductase [Candidatus Woesearchaeota archaeon]